MFEYEMDVHGLNPNELLDQAVRICSAHRVLDKCMNTFYEQITRVFVSYTSDAL